MAKSRQSEWVEITIPKEVGKTLIMVGLGFLAGIAWGITLRTGVSLDPHDWSIKVLKDICRIGQGDIPFNCYGFASLLSALVTVGAYIPVYVQASKIKNARIGDNLIPGFVIGLTLYGVGLFLGIGTILKLIH
jgi:hypothetical protein